MNYQSSIESLLLSTGRDGVEALVEWLRKSPFYDVPASVRFHNNFEHGLAKHSLDVYHEAMSMRQVAVEADPQMAEFLPLDSVTLCSLLHDICKNDVYYFGRKGQVCSRKTVYMKGHGKRSVLILREIGLALSPLEEQAIWWHMGRFEPSKYNYPDDFERSFFTPLCALIQQADAEAARKAMDEQCQ